MKKVIEQTFCDDCGEEAIVEHFSKESTIGFEVDLCLSCIKARLSQSFKQFPMPRTCTECKGKGVTKVYYGHNDYNFEECQRCYGSGLKSFKE